MGLFSRNKPAADNQSETDSRSGVPGLAEHASEVGWKPLGAQPFKSPFNQFVRWASCDIVHMSTGGPGTPFPAVTTFHSAFGGDLNGRSFAIANAYTTGPKGSWVSVAQLWFPTMPELSIFPYRTIRVPSPSDHKTGDSEFDRRFTVQTQDTALADRVLVPAVRAVLQRRDDWYFQMFGYEITCVDPKCYEDVADVEDRLGVLESLLAALPSDFVKDPTPTTQMTFPDGTPIDVTRPEELEAALLRLTPEQQTQILQQFQQLDPAQAIPLLKLLKQNKKEQSN
jgi:hypothetical protein